MEKKSVTVLVVEDDRSLQEDPFVVEAQSIFDGIIFKETTTDALSFVKDNLDKKIIILLDLAFSSNQKDGVEFLSELRTVSKLIPVIIWSGKDNIQGDEYQKIINDTVFAFLKKSASSEEIIEKLNNAEFYMNSQLDSAIESWLENHSEEDKGKPFLSSSDGHSYSMNDLLKEIRGQTTFGKSIALDINKLTLELLFRKKEKI
jgi:DNA-binding NtrC family response regulator